MKISQRTAAPKDPAFVIPVGLHRPVISALQEGKPDEQVINVREDTDLLAVCMSDINT